MLMRMSQSEVFEHYKQVLGSRKSLCFIVFPGVSEWSFAWLVKWEPSELAFCRESI